ncbi:MAG: hypothetical protein JXR76_20610 [Deltaproteobacteria bacterium]|nr:hypothetical protein [Deltaproteobacteria bacterium]
MPPLLIGMIIVGFGTSAPEMASSVVPARKNDHDIAMGNIIGANLFNTLAVVGIAGSIRPFEVGAETLTRDMLVMGTLTLSLFFIGYGFKGRPGRINRAERMTLLLTYVGYNGWLIFRTIYSV